MWELWLWKSEDNVKTPEAEFVLILTTRMKKLVLHIRMRYMELSVLGFVSASMNLIQLSFRNTYLLNNSGTLKFGPFGLTEVKPRNRPLLI